MATVTLADVYDPIVFANAIDEAAVTKNAFINSGVAVSNVEIEAMATTGGSIGELPFYKPLGNEEANYSDDSTDTSTPAKILSGKQIYRRAMMNKSWSSMDIVAELSSQRDPVLAITSKIGGYWATQKEKRTIQSCMGILADNVANDNSDMVVNIATDDVGAPADAELIGADAIIDSQTTLGDQSTNLGVISLHSVPYARLKKLQLIVDNTDPVSGVTFQTYLGMVVIVDDSLPAVSGTNRVTYTSILFERGVFADASGTPKVASEMERKPDTGNGGGEEIVYSRRSDIIHPFGFAFDSTSVAGQSATWAELADAANWDRVYAERKNVGMSFLQTNG